MNLVVVRIRTFPLNEIRFARPRLQIRQRRCVALDEVGVFRNVMHDAHTGLFKHVMPFRLHRADELHQMQPLAIETSGGLAQCLHLGGARVQVPGVKFHQVRLIYAFRRFQRSGGEFLIVGFNDLKRAILGEKPRAVLQQTRLFRRVAHAQFAGPGERLACQAKHGKRNEEKFGQGVALITTGKGLNGIHKLPPN
jgi:hypothetical protein